LSSGELSKSVARRGELPRGEFIVQIYRKLSIRPRYLVVAGGVSLLPVVFVGGGTARNRGVGDRRLRRTVELAICAAAIYHPFIEQAFREDRYEDSVPALPQPHRAGK
jgi:hypothetical protein